MHRNLNNVLLIQCAGYTSAAPAPVLKPKVYYTGVFIKNEWQNSVAGKTFKCQNPATGETIADVQQGSRADIDYAVQAAKDAFQPGSPWRKLNGSERGRLMHRLADLVERDKVYISSLETLNSGKPYRIAYNDDVRRLINHFRYYAGWADKNHGMVLPADGPYFAYTRHEPVGVCGQIITWNFPLLLAAWKLAPALATGNTVVLKPAEQTPLTALFLAQLTKEAGFPAGVVNVVPGFGDAGSELVAHPNVNKISFTGSTETGKLVQHGCAKTTKRVTLELGGKSPNIVLADADLPSAVEQAHKALFYNMGQCCCAGSRTYVEDRIYKKFVQMAAERARNRIVGDPFHEKTEQGPQIDCDNYQRAMRLIESGKKQGAKLMAGGCPVTGPGYFVEPAVFCDVDEAMDIARVDISGPVQSILRFARLDEVIERANNSDYGLAAGIFSKDINKINYLVDGLRAGTIWVNDYNVFPSQVPFGGYKQSGIGRDNGPYGIRNYTEVKSVIVKLPGKDDL